MSKARSWMRILVAVVAFLSVVVQANPRAYAQYTYSRNPGDYHAAWVTQNSYPTLQLNGCYRFVIQFRNVGTAVWYQGVVNLGTDRARDRIPGFIREDRCSGQPSGWISENRVKLQENSVSPGGIGTFVFWYTVTPDHASGTFKEYFRPVADGITWMEDCGCYWDVTVIDRPRLPVIQGSPAQGGQTNPFAAGQCTYYAAKRWIEWGYGIPTSPGFTSGRDAKNWRWMAEKNGYTTGLLPRTRSIMVLDGWGGNRPNPLGHVAIVESVSGQTVVVSHMNWFGALELREGIDQFDISGNSAVSKRNGRSFPLLGFIYPK